MKKMPLLFVFLALGLTACAKKTKKDDLTMMGLDNDGKTVLRYVPKSRYIKKFSPMVASISNEATSRLSRFEQHSPWVFSRVSVGLTLVFEASLFDIVKAEAKPVFELRFQPLPPLKKL